jgi:RNA polymerase sigma factor (sigma-70 family)
MSGKGQGAVQPRWTGRAERSQPDTDAARKRAAVEIVAHHEAALRRTARRYSLDVEDADDAYQRALEIVLTKAPTTDLRELIRWTQTVTKHEAMAVRESRERLLGYRPQGREGDPPDPLAQIAAAVDGPEEQVQRREAVARGREALRTLKPAELRALTLLAEGYSYAEIGEITGFSATKVNRVLAEGRERFRKLVTSSEDGSRCRQLRPLLSAFCDGEASAVDAGVVREHLRACGHCRSTVRAYRATPGIALALTPTPLARSLLERAHERLADLGSRLQGSGAKGEPSGQIAAAGGMGGAGIVGTAKLLALCVGAAGGAACLAAGVVPAALEPERRAPAIVRSAEREGAASIERGRGEPAPPPGAGSPQREPQAHAAPPPKPIESPAEPSGSGATESEAAQAPPPAPPVPPAPAAETEVDPSSSSAAGEFGP